MMTTTDDTRQRSVAEIIGWQRCTCAEGCAWMYPPGADPMADEWGLHEYEVKVTPDDMLAWLVDTGHAWSAQKFMNGVAVTIAYIETGVEWIPPAFEAPTLHEALEAAVRAVAEASDE